MVRELIAVALLDDTAAQAVRASRDPEVAKTYARDMKAGDVFPDIQACQDATGTIWVWDGAYRIAGALLAGIETLPVAITPGDYSDALALARRQGNAKHGVRRSVDDKRHICTGICLEELARQDAGQKPTPSRDLAALAGGTREEPDISHTMVNKELKRLREEREKAAAAEKEQVEQVAAIRDLIPQARALGFAAVKCGYLGVPLDLADTDAALATLTQPWARKAAVEALTAIAARDPLAEPRHADVVLLADRRQIAIVTSPRTYAPVVRIVTSHSERRLSMSGDDWRALVVDGTVIQAAVARPPADPSADPIWEPPTVEDGGLDWAADGTHAAWPPVPPEMLPIGWLSLTESHLQPAEGAALPPVPTPAPTRAPDSGSESPVLGQVLLSGQVVSDAQEQPDAILADRVSEGDARPPEFMMGREGRPCAWADGTVEAALWQRGREALDSLVAAGVVREVTPTAEPVVQRCSACATPTDRIEPSPTDYPLCWRCAVQARDEMIAELRAGAPTVVLPLTTDLLRQIVALIDDDDVSLKNRGLGGPAADRLDLHRYGETITMSTPLSVAAVRAALAEIEAVAPVPPSKPDGDPIREELERMDCMDLVGRLPDQEIGGLVSRDAAEVTAWREALGIPLAMHLRPEPEPVPDFEDVPTPDREALESDLRAYQDRHEGHLPWVAEALAGLISMSDAGLRRIAERLHEATSAADAPPACEDCPIGGRDGDGPACPQASDCDRQCAEHAAAYAAERDPAPPDPTPEEVAQVLATMHRPGPGDLAPLDAEEASPEDPATLTTRLEALLASGVESLPPLSGDGPTYSIAGCLFSLAVYGDDVLADLAARATVAERGRHEAALSEARPYWWGAPLPTLLAELPEAVEVSGRIPSSWARLYPQGKIPSDAEQAIRRAHAEMTAGDWQRTRPHWRSLEDWHGNAHTLVFTLIPGVPEEEQIALFSLLRGGAPEPKMRPERRQELLTASILRHRRPLGAALPVAS